MSRAALNAATLAGLLLAAAHAVGAERLEPPRGKAADLAPAQRAIPHAYFGMHFHRAHEALPPADLLPFGSWRLWDAGVIWPALEPRKGEWRFERMDRLVAAAQARGVELLYTFGMTPQWASSQPARPGPYGPGGSAAPRDLRDWEAYVRTVAERYRGRIRYYELWNEPKFDDEPCCGGFYYGPVATMVDMARIARRVLDDVDPAAKLLSPGFAGEGGRLDAFLAAGGAVPTEILAHHFYALNPEHMALSFLPRHVRPAIAKHAQTARPLWNTEAGYYVDPKNPRLPQRVASYEQLAHYVSRALVLGAASGMERFYWYSWESNLAYPAANGRREINPAGRAYAETVRWLSGAMLERCASDDRKLWVCTLRRGERRAWVLWHTDRTLVYALPDGWQAREARLLQGEVERVAGAREIEVGPSPVLVKSDTEPWIGIPH